jgi:PAS domain S-box-containing protein
MEEKHISTQIDSPQFRQLLEISPDALVAINSAGMIVMANEQLEALFGYDHGELMNQHLDILLPERFREAHPKHRQRYFQEPHARPMGAGLQLFGLRKNGAEFPVDIALRPILINGVTHALAAVRDMTEQREMEQRLSGVSMTLTETQGYFRELSMKVTNLNELIGQQLAPLHTRLDQQDIRINKIEALTLSVDARMDMYEARVAAFSRLLADNTASIQNTGVSVDKLSTYLARRFQQSLLTAGGVILIMIVLSVATSLVIASFLYH